MTFQTHCCVDFRHTKRLITEWITPPSSDRGSLPLACWD